MTCCYACVQVDVLDDCQIDTWTAQLLDRILAHPSPTAHSTDNPNPTPRRRNRRRGGQTPASAAVAQLPVTLQHRLFKAASVRIADQFSTHNLLQYLPPSLHPEILSASVSPQRHLTVFLCRPVIADQFFCALAAMAASRSSSPSPILSLDLYAGCNLRGPTLSGIRPTTIPARADYAAALSLHTGLTALTLGSFEPPFIQGIVRALPSLRCAAVHLLRLDALGEACYPDSLRHLPRPPHRLPALEHLTIDLWGVFSENVTRESSILLNSQRSTDACTYERAMDAIPCLSHLLGNISAITSLHLGVASPILDTTRPLHCPRLRHLEISKNWSGFMMTDQLLSNLRAPALTSLSLVGFMSYDTDYQECGLPLLRHLPSHSSLCRLDFRMPRFFLTFDRRLWHEALLGQLPPPLSALPPLEHLVVEADSELLLRAVPAAASRLRHLGLTCHFPGGNAADQRGAWDALYLSMTRLSMPRLTTLTVAWTNNVEADAMPGIVGLLRASTTLLRLVVCNYRCAFLDQGDIGGLSGLTALEELELSGVDIAEPLHAGLVAALQPLAALRSVRVVHCGLADVFARSLAEDLAAWPDLRILELGCSAVATRTSAEQLLRAVAGWPQFQELMLVVNETVRLRDRGKRRPQERYHVASDVSDDRASVESVELDRDWYSASMSQAGIARLDELAAELCVTLTWR